MKERNPDKPLLAVLAGQPADVPPAWLMRQAGRYLPEYRALRADTGSFLEMCYRPELATEVTLQPIRRFGFDAAILFSDILVVPHGLGQHVAFEEGRGPVLEPIRHVDELDSLSLSRVTEFLAPVYEAVGRIRAALPDAVTLIGFAGAPWTVASYMVEGGTSRDHATARRLAYSDPEGFARLIGLLEAATVEHLSAQIAAGAEVVQIFDSWAGALDEPGLEQWSLQPLTRIVSALRKRHPAIPVILFPRGAGVGMKAFAECSGATALGLDQGVPAAWAARKLGEAVALQGNLDPIRLVAGGSAVRDAVMRLRRTFRGRRYVFNLGHGILPDTPPEHVAELLDAVRSPIEEAA